MCLYIKEKYSRVPIWRKNILTKLCTYRPEGRRAQAPFPHRPVSAGCWGASPPHKPEAVVIRLQDPKLLNEANITSVKHEPDVVNERSKAELNERKSVDARFIGNWLRYETDFRIYEPFRRLWPDCAGLSRAPASSTVVTSSRLI